jgi:hypothetical protein
MSDNLTSMDGLDDILALVHEELESGASGDRVKAIAEANPQARDEILALRKLGSRAMAAICPTTRSVSGRRFRSMIRCWIGSGSCQMRDRKIRLRKQISAIWRGSPHIAGSILPSSV